MLFRSSQSKGLDKKKSPQFKGKKETVEWKNLSIARVRKRVFWGRFFYAGGDQIACQVSEGTHQSDLTHC